MQGLFNKGWDKIHKKCIMKVYTFTPRSPSKFSPPSAMHFFDRVSLCWKTVSKPLFERRFNFAYTAPIIALRKVKRRPLRYFFTVGNRKKSQGAKSGL